MRNEDSGGLRFCAVGGVVTDISQLYVASIFKVTQSRITARGLKSLPGLDVVTNAEYLLSVFLKKFLEDSTSY